MMINNVGHYRLLPVPFKVESYGWGSQNNANPLQASQVLKGLAMSTVSCGNNYSGNWEPFVQPPNNHREGAPHFFCTEGSLASGALCNSDEGGNAHQCLFWVHVVCLLYPVDMSNSIEWHTQARLGKLLDEYWTCSGPLIRRAPRHLKNLAGVFAYRIGGNDTHCVADVTGGRNLNVYVNTMAPKIYDFITAYTKQAKGR